MKKAILILLIICASAFSLVAQKPDPAPWPARSSTVSVYASTLAIASPINISYEAFVHKPRIHYGYTAGLTTLFMEMGEYAVAGGHFAFAFYTGARNHHFDVRLGISVQPIHLYSIHGYWDYAAPVWPVATFGYRFEKPDGKFSFRIGLGTGGVGLGLGYRIGQKS